MLAALASARYRVSERRLALAVAAGVFAIAAIAVPALPVSGAASPTTLPVAARLQPATWAMTIPASWLAAPAPHASAGDSFDLLAFRPSERAAAAPVAYAVVLLAADERGMTVQVDEEDAIAIASARGSGMQFIALLRSLR